MSSDVAEGQTVPRTSVSLHSVRGLTAHTWIVLPAAWCMALTGILAVRNPSVRDGGVVLLLMGAVAAVQAARVQRGADRLPGITADLYLDVGWDRERTLRGAGVGAAGILGWLASERFLRVQDDPFGLAGWLWLGSIVLLLVSTVGWPQPRKGELVAPADAEPMWRSKEFLTLLAVLTIALILRLWDLRDIPYAIHSDEIMTGHVARSSFLQGHPVSVFITVWDNINLPALWFALVAGSLQIFGVTLAALRLPAAIFGALTVLPFYGMVREGWGRRAAICGSVVLTVSASQIHFSRVTLNNIVTPFFWAACFYFLLRGLRRGRPADWALAGIAGGLSEYGYYGTHLLPFVLLGFIAYLVAVHRQYSWESIGRYCLLALGYIAAFGPLLAYYTQHSGLYFGRGQGVLTWNQVPTNWDDLQRMWTVLWPLVSENLLGISTDADAGTLYWAPLLLPLEASLLVLGVSVLIWQWRRPPAFLMLLSGLGTLFVGGTLIHGVPFQEHWTPAFPAFYAAIAVPFALLPPNPPEGTARLLRANMCVPVLLLVGVAAMDLIFYFHMYHAIRPEYEIRAAQSRWEAKLGTSYRVYTVGRTWQSYDAEMNDYLIHAQEGAALFNPASDLPIPPEAGKGLAFVFFTDSVQYEGRVHSLYPGGHWGAVSSQSGSRLFTTYVVPP